MDFSMFSTKVCEKCVYILESVNGVPLKSVISKILAKNQ